MNNMAKFKWIGAMVIVLSLITGLEANTKFFNSVQQICSAYQIKINSSDMMLANLPDGTTELTINMRSSRNNFDRAMLIGFYAAGKAMKYFQMKIDHITVIVNVDYKESSSIYAHSTMEDVSQYVDGQLSSADFVRRLKFS